jgi:hypothetical protein
MTRWSRVRFLPGLTNMGRHGQTHQWLRGTLPDPTYAESLGLFPEEVFEAEPYCRLTPRRESLNRVGIGSMPLVERSGFLMVTLRTLPFRIRVAHNARTPDDQFASVLGVKRSITRVAPQDWKHHHAAVLRRLVERLSAGSSPISGPHDCTTSDAIDGRMESAAEPASDRRWPRSNRLAI